MKKGIILIALIISLIIVFLWAPLWEYIESRQNQPVVIMKSP